MGFGGNGRELIWTVQDIVSLMTGKEKDIRLETILDLFYTQNNDNEKDMVRITRIQRGKRLVGAFRRASCYSL